MPRRIIPAERCFSPPQPNNPGTTGPAPTRCDHVAESDRLQLGNLWWWLALPATWSLTSLQRRLVKTAWPFAKCSYENPADTLFCMKCGTKADAWSTGISQPKSIREKITEEKPKTSGLK
jgi:hypothetical protein